MRDSSEAENIPKAVSIFILLTKLPPPQLMLFSKETPTCKLTSKNKKARHFPKCRFRLKSNLKSLFLVSSIKIKFQMTKKLCRFKKNKSFEKTKAEKVAFFFIQVCHKPVDEQGFYLQTFWMCNVFSFSKESCCNMVLL